MLNRSTGIGFGWLLGRGKPGEVGWIRQLLPAPSEYTMAISDTCHLRG